MVRYYDRLTDPHYTEPYEESEEDYDEPLEIDDDSE